MLDGIKYIFYTEKMYQRFYLSIRIVMSPHFHMLHTYICLVCVPCNGFLTNVTQTESNNRKGQQVNWPKWMPSIYLLFPIQLYVWQQTLSSILLCRKKSKCEKSLEFNMYNKHQNSKMKLRNGKYYGCEDDRCVRQSVMRWNNPSHLQEKWLLRFKFLFFIT